MMEQEFSAEVGDPEGEATEASEGERRADRGGEHHPGLQDALELHDSHA